MTKSQKTEKVLKMMRGDISQANHCKKYADKIGYAYNEGLARARLSTLFECGIIDHESLVYWSQWIDEHIE